MLEINIKDLIRLVFSKWWVFVSCILISGSAAYIWTNYFTIPVYSSSTTLYVGKNIESEGIQTSDLSLGSILINDYRELAKSKLVAREVIEEMGLRNVSPASLAGKIVVSQKNESRVIQISVNDTNPQMAMELTNKVAEVLQKKIIEIMQIENVQIIDRAELQPYPVSPNHRLNYMIGIILGLIVGMGIILLIIYFDNTVKTPEDVKKHLDLPVIGTIPTFKAEKNGV
ncbi:MAG TPA: hypothetical protein GXZ22_09615 [Clostridiaceae bacterium]|mgnify:FL=1|nr:hypothetical protein [Bacillota bacterium]HHU91293.1 hypothetical protein [Clostridiaceae bacterium]